MIKNNLLNTIVLSFFFLYPLVGFHQDSDKIIRNEGLASLKKCSQLYIELNKFSIDVEYSVFYNKKSFNYPDDVANGRIIRMNNEMYLEEAENITIYNKDYLIHVNSFSQIINVQRRKENDIIPNQVNLDSVGSYVGEIRKIDKGFQYTLNRGEIAKIDMEYTSNGYLSEMRSYYRYPFDFGDGEVNVVTQIKYTNFNLYPNFSDDFFSESKILAIKDSGEISPVGKYAGYKIISRIK